MAAVARAIIRVMPASRDAWAQKSCAHAKNGKFVKFHEYNQNTTKQHQVQFLICLTMLSPASPPDQNTGPASNVNITRSIAVHGAHDENCNVNITALEGLGDSFSDDSEWISANPKDLDNTNTIGKGRGSRYPSPTAPPLPNSASAVFSVAHIKNVF